MPFRWTGGQPARQKRLVSLLLALVALILGGAPGWAASVEAVDVAPDHVTLRFDARVAAASTLLLAGPRRIAIDVSGAEPGAALAAGDGPVARIRQARNGGGTRIVLDLAQPAIVTEGIFDADGRTLTLALRTVDDAAFARAAADGRVRFLPPFSYAGGAVRASYAVTLPVPAARRAPGPLPRVYGDDDSRPLVVIDAGHGGVDPGAIGAETGLREKDVTLAIAKAIRDELLASGRVRVALTREDDRFIVLQDRFGIARRLKADLFISIHCDSVGAGQASGATVYTLSEVASDKEAARLAARENKADIIQGVNLASTEADISSLLIDLTQRETMNQSAAFARLLGREAKPLMPVKPNFHRMASLMVLKAPDMPSILFETGYISNPQDANFIGSPRGQAAIAESVRRAVDIHFARRLAAR